MSGRIEQTREEQGERIYEMRGMVTHVDKYRGITQAGLVNTTQRSTRERSVVGSGGDACDDNDARSGGGGGGGGIMSRGRYYVGGGQGERFS